MPRLVAALILLSLLSLVGCRSAEPAPEHAGPPAITTTNEAYSLLYELVAKQADVDKALWFRKTPADFAVVIKEIAEASRQSAERLKEFAAADPSLQLSLTPLPLPERETRASIESAETKALLTTAGTVFRRRLLLSQASSMQYAQHLALTLSKRETAPGRQSSLLAMSERFAALEKKVVEQLSLDEVPDKK
jgi:hypothetical protein